MNPVGDAGDRYFDFGQVGPQVVPHFAADGTVQFGYPVAKGREAQRHYRHTIHGRLRCFFAQFQKFIPTNTHFVSVKVHIFAHEGRVKMFVAGNDGRMGGKNGRGPHFFARLVKREVLVFHQINDALEE